MSKSTKKHLDLTDDNENELKINEDFSERYERYRSKEVLQQLKDKYGDQIWQSGDESDEATNEDSEESDSTSELDDDELFDEKFLRVLGALKSKDETIYDQNSVFYTKEDVVDLDMKKELKKQNKNLLKSNKTQKMDLTDYHKKLIKEKKGLTAEDVEMEYGQEEPKTSLGYYEELKVIKQNLLQAAGNENDADDLIVGKKVIEYSDNEDQDQIDAKKILETKDDKYIKKLNKFWKSKKLNEKEKFLRDFIINKTYLSDDESDNKNTNKADYLKEEERSEDEYDSDDSTHRKLVQTYESTRFHHEEPDADKIKRFPRQIESIRDIALKKKKTDKRSEMKERKKHQKEAELRKLRELKRNEISNKVSLLEKTTGAKLRSKLKEIDIDMLVDDTDFDAEKYDQKMAELFNDEYYGIEEDQNANEKPKFEYDSDVDGEKYYTELDQGLVADEDDYKGEIINDEQNDEENSNDDINEFDEDDLNQNKLSRKKKLRLKKKEKAEKKKKDKFALVSKSKNFGIYEDVIDGQGIRFKYRKTQASNYGLTDEEILLADEKELNRWVSLSKSQQFEDDEQDIEKYDRKGKNLRLKKKILKSIYGSSDDETDNHKKDDRMNYDGNHYDKNEDDTNNDKNGDDTDNDKNGDDTDNDKNGDNTNNDKNDDDHNLQDNVDTNKRKKKSRRKKNKKPKLTEQE